MSYTQVSAGFVHALLLRSNGTVVACGGNHVREYDIPPLDEGMSYNGLVTTLLSHAVLSMMSELGKTAFHVCALEAIFGL